MCIRDSISDHAVNISECAKEMHTKGLSFSKKAIEEIHIFNGALNEILDTAITAFEHGDIEQAKSVEPLEEVIDNLRTEIRNRHVKRLRKGKCTIEMCIRDSLGTAINVDGFQSPLLTIWAVSPCI